MSEISALNTVGSGLAAERFRLDLIASNIANGETTRTPQGGPYHAQRPIFMARPSSVSADGMNSDSSGGVDVVGIAQDNSERLVYDPKHPDADAQGYVHYPNVNVVAEMTDMVAASRAYEANLSVLSATKYLANQALDIGRG